MQPPKIAIVFCCEYGILEPLTLLMVRSLLRFGNLSDRYSLYCFSPRKLYLPSRATLKSLESMGVSIITEPLNRPHSYYPLINKVLACEYVCQEMAADYIVFIDSDCVMLNPLDTDPQLFSRDIAVQREFGRIISAHQPGDAHYEYWKKILDLCQVKKYVEVRSFLFDQPMIGYWNSGFFTSKTSHDLILRWKENLINLLDNYHWRGLQYYFLEQVSFSVTIQQLELTRYELQNGYNYPIGMHSQVCDLNRIHTISEITVAHYLKEYRETLTALEGMSGEGQKAGWLADQFRELRIHPKSFRKRLVITMKSQRNAQLQKALFLAKRLRRTF